MKKKKNNQNTPPIELSKEELIPAVIGVINEKEKNNWILVFIFILLISFIIGLPTITNFFNGEYEKKENTPSNTDKPGKIDDTPNEKMKLYSFSDTSSINVEGLTFDHFRLNDETIELQITNNSESKNYLATHKLYLDLYDKDQMLLQRIKLSNENLNKGVTQNYTYDLNTPKTQISQFVIEEKKESDYPSVDLKKESDQIYSLTCSKNAEKLTYQFNEEQKLMTITNVINYPSSHSEYLKLIADYRQTTSKYNAIEGVKSNIVEAGNGFTVTTNIDLSIVDLNDRVIRNTLDNVAYYGKDTEGKVIYFELSAMNYQCS